jgi:hypothetical protein
LRDPAVKTGSFAIFSKKPVKIKDNSFFLSLGAAAEKWARGPRRGLTCPGGFPYNALTAGIENWSKSHYGKFFYLP